MWRSSLGSTGLKPTLDTPAQELHWEDGSITPGFANQQDLTLESWRAIGHETLL